MKYSIIATTLLIFVNLLSSDTLYKIKKLNNNISDNACYIDFIDLALDNNNNLFKDILVLTEKKRDGQSVCYSLKQNNTSPQAFISRRTKQRHGRRVFIS